MAEVLRCISGNLFETGFAITMFSVSLAFLFIAIFGSMLLIWWLIEFGGNVLSAKNGKTTVRK